MHPSEEDWMGFLYGEIAGDSREGMAEHLRECGECRERLARWRGVIKELDSWRLPRARVRSMRLRTGVRWAAAAVVLVAVGFGVGRLWALPSVDAAALHASLKTSLEASLEPSIRRSLREELAAEYRASNAALKTELAAALYRPLSADIRSLEAETLATRGLVVELADALTTALRDDRLALAAAFDELESRRAADYAQLNNGLYTLADAAGSEILVNRGSIAELFAYTTQTRPAEDDDAVSPNERRAQ